LALLYIETNYLMGVATGRYPPVEDLLPHLSGSSFRLGIPEICFMEALAALQAIQARRNKLAARLDRETKQLNRSVNSNAAMRLVEHLEGARLDNYELINEFQERLSFAVDAVGAESDLIHSTHAVLRRCAKKGSLVMRQPTDNLILRTIADHAGRNPAKHAFFTENASDFRGNQAQAILKDAGVSRVIYKYDDVIRWLDSQSAAQ
jgi:hypothetical protein